MTETNRYEHGKIYKLVSPHTDKIYIGSTCKKYLSQRLASHKIDYKKRKQGLNIFISSFELFDLGDVEIVLLENVNCNTKDELLKIERDYYEKYKDILVNKHRPFRSDEEDKKIRNKYKKEYRIINSERTKKYDKEYREKNKELIKQQKKQLYECECGKILKLCCKSKHNRTVFHNTHI
jgi:hypothetical protein